MKERGRILFAWVLLILLVMGCLVLSYFKFFGRVENPNIELTPIETSTNKAIDAALLEIVNRFNGGSRVAELEKSDEIKLRAVLNNHSIFITYTKEEATTTFEFYYSNLNLSIDVANDLENMERFMIVYRYLIYALQARLENDDYTEQEVEGVVSGQLDIDGYSREEFEDKISYKMDITKKIIREE